MEPFTLLCPTCQSQIRVRNANLIGQIANCPKCNGMLQIAKPASATSQIKVPGEQAVDSMAVTKEGIVATELPLTGGKDGESEDYQLAPLEAPPIASADTPFDSVDWQPESTPLIPSEQWTSQSTTQTRQFLLIAFLGLASTTLAAIAFFAFLSWFRKPEPTPAGIALDGSPQALLPLEDSPSPMVNSLAEDGDAEISDQAPAEPTAPADANSAELFPAQDLPGPSPEESMPSPLAPDTPAIQEGGRTAEPSESPVNLAETDATVSSDAPPTAEPAQPQLPKQLQVFGQILDYQIQPQLPDAVEVLSAAPLTAEDLGLPSGDAKESMVSIDWNVHSQTRLPGLLMAPQALPRCVSLWTNISGVPTVVDLDSLIAAGIDPNQAAGLELVRSATIATVANKLAESMGLSATSRENRYLELSAPSASIEAKLPQSIALHGLIEGLDEARWLRATLAALFEQQEWPAAELLASDLQLARPAGSHWSTWFEVIRLLETWRAARGAPAGIEGYESERIRTQFVEPAALDDALNTTIREVLPQSRPVAQVLPRVCSEAGLSTWIDWPNVASVGLAPHTTALFVTAARPLREVLADYAEQFSLVVAIEDKATLWLTSAVAYRQQTRVYAIDARGQNVEQWQQQLRTLTPSGPAGVGTVTVIATPDQKFMLIRCCRPQLTF